MNILFLSPYPPYPPRGGGALRIVNLLRGLAASHTITLLSFAPNTAAAEELRALDGICRVLTVIGPKPRNLLERARTTLTSPLPDMALRNVHAGYRAALEQVIAAEHFDLVQAESIEMAGYGMLAQERAPADHTPRIVLDQFNAEYLLQRRAALSDLRRGLGFRPRALLGGGYSLIQWRKLAAYERRMLRAYDRVLVVSEEDRIALRRLDKRADPVVIPNGVDTASYRIDRLAPLPAAVPSIVFTGTLDYRPNIDAITWYVREVLPLVRSQLPQARLLLVGRAATPAIRALHDGTSVELIGEVPDVRPYLTGASVFALPMRIGGGSRLKLLEAFASGAAVVSTPMGAEGIVGLRHEEHLLLADQAQAFADAIVRIISDRSLARRLGAAGQAHVAAQYDWSAIIPRLEAVYSSM